MPQVYKIPYSRLKKFTLLLISILDDEEFQNKWYSKIDELDKLIEIKKEYATRARSSKSTVKRLKFKPFSKDLDFS